MDLEKMFKKVSNLNDYISITQEMANYSHINMKIQFNMSSVLLLKKVRSLEIEYFNKCEGNGAALVLFERMVEQPPSKTWGLLGKELVALLQYWLDAMRKHLIKHSHHWWIFLKLLLKFIKNIRAKDKSLPDTIIEGTAECLLDLATSTEPDTAQRHEILYCLNLCCAESSREIRFALRDRLESYFTKLATLMASCGHLPTQYSMLEALLRWLLPRHEVAVRQAAAARWFPAAVYGKRAVQLFLERPWQNFFQDARDFLNAFNAMGNLVSSFLCRKITVGTVILVSGTEKRVTWLDLNSWDSSASVVLDPRLLDALCVPDAPSWESLRVPARDAGSLQLCREASEVTLVIHTTQAPRLWPSDAVISEGCEVRVVMSSATDLRHFDRALRDIFSHKYQVLLDLDKPISLSPLERFENKNSNSSMAEDTRFSHPVEVQKRKRSGFMVRSRNPPWKSPSTASTTSLAQLHEKLASLPQYQFDKEAVHVCAQPELSTVTEVSETDDRQSLLSTSTFKLNRPFGVCHKNNKSHDRNSQSDGEVHNKPKVGRYLSPANKDEEHSTSCLLVATIGSADESIINDTLERLTKNKDFQSDNIVDLLVQEALQKDFNDKDLRDSGINTGDNRKTPELTTIHSEAIENTPVENLNANLVQNKVAGEKACTVISNTTTDESNDVVDDTPLSFVNVRKKNVRAKVAKEKATQKPVEEQIFNVKEINDFFSQHITENNCGEIIVSPTLARKINETSSESEQFDNCLMVNEENYLNVEQIDVYNIDIIECLNSVVDKVCSDLEKCTELLNCDTTAKGLISIADNIAVNNPIENDLPPLNVGKCRKNIKLRYNTTRTVKTRANKNKKKNKLELDSASNMSVTKKGHDTVVTERTIKTPESVQKSSNESVDLGVPLTRRKRKLYSPKDEGDNEIVLQVTDMNNDEDFKTTMVQSPMYKATSYKDIEMDRKLRWRQVRNKSRVKSESSPSPRTKKNNDIFNRLKEKVECPDSILVVDKRDLAEYNFTSDSEDEDFKRKKNEIQKRISSTTIASGDSIMSTRYGRQTNRINYYGTKLSDEPNKKNPVKQKRKINRKKAPKSRIAKPALIDEKMRDAVQEELNTSLVVDKPIKDIDEEPKLTLPVNPQMEPIPDETITKVTESNQKPKKTSRKNKKTDALSLKKEKIDKINTLNIEKDKDEGTISPLPGLIVETMPAPNNDANDSVSANMLKKFKKIYQDGPEAYINESNTTQNLLSDVEKINYSPPPMNITDELNKAGDNNKLSDLSNEITDVPLKSSNNSLKKIVLRLPKNCNVRAEVDKIAQKMKLSTVKIKTIKNEMPELVNLIDLSHDDSEVSIATVGMSPITGHGDSDEEPPNSELLAENIKPRDLLVEYMDQPTKDYFYKLRAEVTDLPSNGTKDSIGSDTLVPNNTENRSPVVSVSRLSPNDISKWLPSRRNSDTDSNYSEVTSKDDIKLNQALNKNVKEHSDLISENDDSPVQKIDKISLEFDIRNNEDKTSEINQSKFVQSSLLLNENTKQKSAPKECNRKAKVNLEDSKRVITSKLLQPQRDCLDTEKKNSNSVSIVHQIGNATPKKNDTVQASQENRKSMISPIKLYEDYIKSRKAASTSITVEQLESELNNIDEELKNVSDEQSYDSEAEKNDEVSKISCSTKIEENVSRLKRRSKSPVIGDIKKRKVEAVVSISNSGPSESSVNEWLKTNLKAPISRADNASEMLHESIEHVMEKLDTTVHEIHRNTVMKLMYMFVDAQKQLASLKQERRNMYKSVTSDILKQVFKLVDEKFLDLNKRSEEMDTNFMEQLREHAVNLIREDYEKKQVMVDLLRGDLNATLARIQKGEQGNLVT